MPPLRPLLIWIALALIVLVPILAAFYSPLMAWRDPIHIGAALAGVVALALLFLQPLMAAQLIPRVPPRLSRIWHRRIGAALVLALILHVGGLWITSPPDMIDALLLRAPTGFSVWGVIAMVAVLLTAGIALYRRHLPPRVWRGLHVAFALVIVGGSTLHAWPIIGMMNTGTKAILCLAVLAATARALVSLRRRHRRAVAT